MTKHILAIYFVAAIAASCSEDGEKEYHQVPYPGEYVPAVYTIGPEKPEYPVEDCKDNIADFSSELNEFMSGNLVVGNIECAQCPGYKGQYTWASRCDQNNHYDGTWSTPDYGATMSFEPTLVPDSSLHFSAVSSIGIWKLRYNKGEEFVTIHYKMKRN